MADMTSQDVADMLSQLKDMNKSLNKLVKTDGDRAKKKGDPNQTDVLKGTKDGASDLGNSFKVLGNGVSRLALHLESNTTNMVGSFKKLAGASEGAGGIFTKTAATFVTAGAMIGGAVEQQIKQTFQVYQGLRDVGQTFGGSLLQLQLSAAQARLPFSKFADLIKSNGVAAATIGANGLGQMSRGLRESLKDFGELGMSTDQLNEVVGNYTQTMTLFGRLQNTSSAQAVASMRDLSIEATALAGVSGKNRMELLKDANAAMSSAILRASAVTQEGRNSEQVIQATTKAALFLSSLPGEAGKTLSTMLADTVGSGGSYMTSAMQEFTKAGLYGVGSMMDTLANKVRTGQDLTPEDEAKFAQDFVKQGKANMETLKIQAMAGNQAAIHAIGMIKDIESNSANYTAEAITKAREQAEVQTKATKAISNLEEIFNEVSGAIREKFLQTIITISESPAFDKLMVGFKNLGEQVQALWDRVFTPQHIEQLMSATIWMGEKLVGGISLAVDGFTKVVRGINYMVDTFGKLGTAAMLLALYFGSKFLMKKYAQTQADSRQRVALAAGISEGLRPFREGNSIRVNTGGGGFSSGEDFGTGPEVPRGARYRRAGRRAGQRVGGLAGSIRRLPGNIRDTAQYGLSAARVGARGLMRNPGRLAGGAGLAAGVAGAALDFAPDFKGKETLGSALSLGGMGAQIGMMFGPLGALVGGGIGALAGVIMSNWDPIKNTLSKAISWIGDAVTGVFNWVKEAFKFTPLGLVIQAFDAISKNGIGGTFDIVKEKIGGFFDSVSNVFSSVGDWLASKFSWLKNFDVFGIMKKAIAALPGGSLLVGAFERAVGTSTSSVSGPTTAENPKTPSMEMQNMQTLVNTLQKQQADMSKQMAAQHQVMNKMLDALQRGNAQDQAIGNDAREQLKKLQSQFGNVNGTNA